MNMPYFLITTASLTLLPYSCCPNPSIIHIHPTCTSLYHNHYEALATTSQPPQFHITTTYTILRVTCTPGA
ncbi:hypothetical protein DFJ43DRAFT_1090558 [Lentinula guzmanii]|uniref:Secreted protein n=1 Tax=Lentinula guzmanii TaxID=2804957 RepID=A0AA38JET7_9AGAR|nr:hypothetical protein DFJ43DRAFT_1090558 [Lentinula guzmanii]